MKEFTHTDWIVCIFYAMTIVFVGLWVSRPKKGVEKTSNDYFLASRSLPWWAVGSTLLAANISAEHFIAMSGSGYAIGLAIAAYEWIAAISLIVVAKFFLPVFIEKGIFMMPQFLSDRNLKPFVIPEGVTGRRQAGIGIRLMAAAMLTGIIASFFVYPLRNLTLEAIYVPVVAFILIGLILVLNNKLGKTDARAIVVAKSLFNTSATFNIASVGICGILAALYYFFW